MPVDKRLHRRFACSFLTEGAQPGGDPAAHALSVAPSQYLLLIRSTTWSGKNEITGQSDDQRHLALRSSAYPDELWQEWKAGHSDRPSLFPAPFVGKRDET